MIKLRDYQTGLIEGMRREFRLGVKRLICYAPTGAGKTEVGMEMVRLARSRETKVAFVANRIGLVEQASKRFYKSGITHGVIQGANTRNADSGVLVCSIQTLAKRGYPEVGLLLIDEAHAAAGSDAYRKLMLQYPKVPVVGLTATPFSRGLGKRYDGLGRLFETIVKTVTINDLVKLGFLVDCDIWAPSEPDLSKVKVRGDDYDQAQLGVAVDKPELIGNIVAHWKKLGRDKQTVCFATNIAHSKHIAEQFNAAGISCEHIDCYTPDEERRAILSRIDSGETRIVTNCAVLAEGWDSPRVEVMICARPTRSLIRWIQMAGRILRPFEGKNRAIILDHSGTAVRLGFPTDDLPLRLDEGKPKKAGEDEKEEPLPKLCAACKFLKPPKVHACPQCGFAPEKQANIEVDESKQLEQLRRKRKKDYSTAEREVVYSELLGYCREKGWKDGWAYHAARDLFGVAPRHQGDPLPPSDETRTMIRGLIIRRVKSKEAQGRRDMTEKLISTGG